MKAFARFITWWLVWWILWSAGWSTYYLAQHRPGFALFHFGLVAIDVGLLRWNLNIRHRMEWRS